MTMMDTDSESQDSDDGRRFRFETTRKDIGPSIECKKISPKRELKHKSHSRHYHRNKDESRYNDHKELKSKTVKHEDSKYRDHRERGRDNKKYKTYEKDRRHKHRSRDRSYDRFKRHSWSRSRDRSRSPRYKSREEYKKQGSSKKEDKIEHRSERKEHQEEKTVNQTNDQNYKDTDLADYNILSETEENLFETSDKKRSRSNSNSPIPKKLRKETTDKNEFEEDANLENLSPLADSDNKSSTVLEILSDSKSSTQDSTKDFEDDKLSDDENVGSSVESDEFIYGPLLPPKNSKQSSNETQNTDDLLSLSNTKENVLDDDKIEEDTNFIGPCLPQINVPEKSDETKEKETSNDDNSCEEDLDSAFGPALPPHLQKQTPSNTESRNRVMGPLLPDGIKLSLENTNQDISESEPEDAIGPLPVDHPALRSSYVHEQLERRAKRIKHELMEETDSASNNREEWMTELPPAHSVQLGLSARKFRITPAPDMSDRSCWSDTPAQKAEKQRQKETDEAFNVKDSNKVEVKEYEEVDKSRKHARSLLEMHQEKLKKKKKAKEKEAKLTGESTRRPFDRDIDLQINRMNSNQRKSIIRKAQCLDDRFTRGGM